jgi:ribosomal protein L10
VSDAQNNVEVIVERLGTVRNELRAYALRLEVVQNTTTELLAFRTSLERDITDLRQAVQGVMLANAETNRTAEGIGKALDEYRKAEEIKAAKLAGELRLLQWLAGLAGASVTAVVIEWALRLFGYQ